MTITPTNEQTPRKPLRLWPGVVIAIVLGARKIRRPLVGPEAELYSLPLPVLAFFAGMAGTLAIVGWWLFFSRAYWSERLSAIVLMVVALFATLRLVDKSIAGGMMGAMLFVYSIPGLGLALVVWAVATHRLANGARRVWMVVAILLACVPWTLVRTAGESSDGSEFHWRWTATPEQRLLAQAGDDPDPPGQSRLPPATAEIPKEPIAPTAGDKPVTLPEAAAKTEPVSPPAAKPRVEAPAVSDQVPRVEGPPSGREVARAEWPGFRGPDRDSVVRGVRINTDWSASPPVELWRRPIGPGWSSFAVSGDLLYTQEQRGDDEIVACYRVSTGTPVWMHRDKTRFWESNAGAGPRGTPTLSNGRVYAFGATGILNALDARGGAVVWSRNVASDTKRAVPDWGFASSPLVIDDVVIVAASGTLAAYDVATGKTRWIGPQHGGSYSSPHRATIDGVEQVLLLSPPGAISVAPAEWRAALGAHVGRRRDRSAGADRRWRCPDQRHVRHGRNRHAPSCGQARICRMVCRGALDVARVEAVLQRLRRSQGPCLRLRRQHPRVHRPGRRQAQVEGRTLRPGPAGALAGSGCPAGGVGGG